MQRRTFLKNAAMIGSLVVVDSRVNAFYNPEHASTIQGKRVGVIGLDTSHSVEFARVLNTASTDSPYNGYRVTAAYP